MKLLGEIAREASPAGPVREAVDLMLRAAAENPALLARAPHDPLFRPIAGELRGALKLLHQRAEDAWQQARSEAAAAVEDCRPWMTLAEGTTHAEFREHEARLEDAEALADRGDPIAWLEAEERAVSLTQDAVELCKRTREQVTAAIVEALQQLSVQVEEARPELKSTDEWVEAKVATRESDAQLKGLSDADDAAAREMLEEVRHRVGLHAELISVMNEDIERREQQRAKLRETKLGEDRAVLRAQRDRMSKIHIQLGATAFLAVIFFWAGPLLILTSLPAVLAFLNALDARKTLSERVWSIPREEVDTTMDELATRMIVSILLVMGVATVLVIQWMVTNVG